MLYFEPTRKGLWLHQLEKEEAAQGFAEAFELFWSDMQKLGKVRQGFGPNVVDELLGIAHQLKKFECVSALHNQIWPGGYPATTRFLFSLTKFLFLFGGLPGDTDWQLALWLHWRKRAQVHRQPEMEAFCEAKISALADTARPDQIRLTDHAARCGVRFYEALWEQIISVGTELNDLNKQVFDLVLPRYMPAHQAAYHVLIVKVLSRAIQDVLEAFYGKSPGEINLSRDFLEAEIAMDLLSQGEVDEALAEYQRLRGPLKNYGGGGSGRRLVLRPQTQVRPTEATTLQLLPQKLSIKQLPHLTSSHSSSHGSRTSPTPLHFPVHPLSLRSVTARTLPWAN